MIDVSDLCWTWNNAYHKRCFYNPYPHGSATWSGRGPTGTRNCQASPWNSGRGGYNYRHELLTCSPEFVWCKILKAVCESGNKKIVKRTAGIGSDATWAALQNAGYIIYDESAHTWHATSQGHALNDLIKRAFAEFGKVKETEKTETTEKTKTTEGSFVKPGVADVNNPSTFVENPITGLVEKPETIEKVKKTKIKTIPFMISKGSGTADFGPAGCFGKNFDDTNMDSSSEIDEYINKFIADKKVISISVQYPTVDRHNNGGLDTVLAIYTIIYND
jgi:hypothetical protein